MRVDNLDRPGVPMSSLGRVGSQRGELLGPLACCPILDGARHSMGSCSEVRRVETCEQAQIPVPGKIPGTIDSKQEQSGAQGRYAEPLINTDSAHSRCNRSQRQK